MQLAKDCEFRAVIANENNNLYVRYAFISELSSVIIRQRILKNSTLDLQSAYNQASLLENAQLQSSNFSLPSCLVIAVETSSKFNNNPDDNDMIVTS